MGTAAESCGVRGNGRGEGNATETDAVLDTGVREVVVSLFSEIRFFALPNYNLELRCLQRRNNKDLRGPSSTATRKRHFLADQPLQGH